MKKHLPKHLALIGLIIFILAFTKSANSQTFTPNTNGVTTLTTLVNGQTGIVLFGITMTNNTGSTISVANPVIYFKCSATNPYSSYFPSMQLSMATNSGTQSASTATAITASITNGGSGIQATISSYTITIAPGVSVSFFLTSNCTFSGALSSYKIDFDKIFSYYPAVSYSNSATNTSKTYNLIMYQLSATGYNSTSNGITAGSLLYGQTGIVLFGFGLTGYGNFTISSIYVAATANAGTYFFNGKIYRSPTSTFSLSTATQITAATLSFSYGSGNGVNISGLTETFTATAPATYYYFIVADFTAGTSFTAPSSIQFDFNTSQSPVAINAGSSTLSYNGFSIAGNTFTIGQTFDWLGKTSTDFSDKNNYINQNNTTPSTAPSSTDLVQIGVKAYQYPNYQPTVSANTTIAKLIVGTNNTPTIIINSGKTLTVNGNVISGGNTSSLTVNGSSTLLVNGPGTLNLGASTTIASSGILKMGPTSILSLADASSTITNSGSMNLMSDATGSAAIAAIPAGAMITGNVNVQRFITGGSSAYRSYRLLSSPVNISSNTSGGGNISLAYINTTQTLSGTTYYGALTGGPGTGFTVSNANPTIYIYNESIPASNTTFTSGKPVGVTTVGASTVSTLSRGASATGVTLPVSNGYYLYFIGDNHINTTASSRVPESTIITATGYINQGDVPVKIWNTSSSPYLSYASAAYPGFNLIGNPYPSTIDLNLVYADNSSAGFTTFYIALDKNPGQSYVSYIASTGSSSSSVYSARYIASGQGFMVLATGASQALTFKEDQKVPGQVLSTTSSPVLQLSVRKPESLALAGTSNNGNTAKSALALTDDPSLNAGLHLKLSLDSVTNDECGVYFSNKSSDNFDKNDAYDLDGVSPVVYLSSYTANAVRVGINSLGTYLKGKKVKLYVKGTKTASYTLQLEDFLNIDTSVYHVDLVDNLMKDSVDMLKTKSYTFTITTTDTTTFGSDRFVLSIQRKVLPPYQLLSLTGQKATSSVLLNWKTTGEGAYTGFALQKQNSSGTAYTTLYSVQSTGSGNYSYTDANPSTGNNVYRLMQNSIDSAISYSKPITVVYNIASPLGLLTIYPNPAKDVITVNFNNATYSQSASASYQFKIYNSMGAVVSQSSVNSNSWTQNVSGFQPGSYIIEVRTSGGSLIGNSKFVKYQ